MSDDLIDEEGNVHSQGPFSSQWHQRLGLFGPEKDVNFFGQPNIQRDFFGRPVQARNAWGTPTQSNEGRQLYEPISYEPTSYIGSTGGGDALAAGLAIIVGIGLVMLLVYVVGALLAVIGQIIYAIINGYRQLIRRYPRAMLFIHLLIGTTAVGFAIRLAGFSLQTQLFGAALVPILYGWMRLTQRLPLIFMPINAVLVGGGLWFGARALQESWQPVWTRLTVGLPLVSNLPAFLAVLPMMLWLWSLGADRWPLIFHPLGLVMIGMILWFLLVRVWPGWRTPWNAWFKPVPIVLPLTNWFILFMPLALWLWLKGQEHLPMLFFGLNLLLFGGLLGLTAHHTQSHWVGIWNYWMRGLPFLAFPILTISLAPTTLWGWTWISNRWRRLFIIPNLLLTGGILWWIFNRSRPLWEKFWLLIWGQVPITIDLALILLALPFTIWVWRKGKEKWPQYWGAARALLLGGILWWATVRTKSLWQGNWQKFADPEMIDLATLVLVFPLLLWVWSFLHKRWPKFMNSIALIIMMAALGWITVRLLPNSSWVFRSIVVLLPLFTISWLILLQRRPLIGWPLSLLPWMGIGLLALKAPDRLRVMIVFLWTWLTKQGIPLPHWF